MKYHNNQLLKITTTAFFIALTCVLTLIVRIPSPTKGYINLGDCAVLFGGLLLGPVYGTIAGGIGSALADFFAGYPVYVPGTLIIKGIMAFIISLVPYPFSASRKKYPRAGFAVGAVISELFMVAGYYFYEAVVIGEGFIPAIAGVSGNVVQGIAGIAGTYFLIGLFSRTDIFKTYRADDSWKGNTK